MKYHTAPPCYHASSFHGLRSLALASMKPLDYRQSTVFKLSEWTDPRAMDGVHTFPFQNIVHQHKTMIRHYFNTPPCSPQKGIRCSSPKHCMTAGVKIAHKFSIQFNAFTHHGTRNPILFGITIASGWGFEEMMLCNTWIDVLQHSSSLSKKPF